MTTTSTITYRAGWILFSANVVFCGVMAWQVFTL